MSIRKPIGLGLIVGILALALAAMPAMASAATTLKKAPGGAALAVGAPLTGFSNNLVFDGAAANLECKSNTLTGTVAKNAPNEPEVTITSALFKAAGGGAQCLTSVAGLTTEVSSDPVLTTEKDWTLKFGKEDKFTLSSSTGTVAFTAKFNAGFECTFQRATVTGTYNTSSKAAATLTVGAGQVFTRNAGPEAQCGKEGTLTGSFTISSGGVGVEVTP